MSEFNRFAVALNESAKKAFSAYQEAEKAYQEACKQADGFPAFVSPQDTRKAYLKAKAYKERSEAQEALKYAQEALRSNREIGLIRMELEKEIDRTYAVKPEAIDSNAVSLLESGIMRTNDYVQMAERFEAEGNHTMIRYMAKYAEDMAEKLSKRDGESDETRALRAIGIEARNLDGAEYLQAFDTLKNVYERSANNPAMIDCWDDLTAEAIEEF